MIVETGRFGQLNVDENEIINMPNGVLGFPELRRYVLVDPADDALILWLQSLDRSEIAFPAIEPKIFKSDYVVKLSAADQRELGLERINKNAGVLSLLTIPQEIMHMSANIKAPLVINLENNFAKQVVLQENEYSVNHPMFKELKAHVITIQSQASRSETTENEKQQKPLAFPLSNLTPFDGLRSLTLS